jgi:hypothetical protein
MQTNPDEERVQPHVSSDQLDIPRRAYLKRMAGAAAVGLGAGLGCAINGIPLVHAQGNTIIAMRSISPVTVDGKWTNPEEWKEERDIVAPGNAWKVKHDDEALYVLFDFYGDTMLDAPSDPSYCDSTGIQIDTLKNGGNKPQPDDYSFRILWLSPTQPTLEMSRGTGTGWANIEPSFSGASSMDASNDPYSSNPHLIYEYRIPKSILPANTSSVYCRLAAWDGNGPTIFTWPRNAYGDNPNAWGKLELSEKVIPEFSSTLLPLALALGIPLYLLRKHSGRREAQTPSEV